MRNKLYLQSVGSSAADEFGGTPVHFGSGASLCYRRMMKLYFVILIAALLIAAAVPSFAVWKFASTSDSHAPSGSATLTTIRNLINAEGVDLLIMQGDLVDGTSDDAALATQYDTWKSVMSSLNCPYYVVPGNHDISTATSENVWRSKFSMPLNGPSGYEETVWSFDHENAHFVGLNSDHYGEGGHIQLGWLANDLNTTNKPHIFTMCHEAAYTMTGRGSFLGAYPAERDAFWSNLAAHGSKLFFCGHEHVYSNVLFGSIYQQINGPSGGQVRCCYTDTLPGPDYVVVTIDGNNVSGVGKDINGNVIHSWSYSVPAQTPYSGVIQLPGTIEAENFDEGGEGVGYHDTTTANEGGQYRATGVDIENCSEGGYNVGYINTGERLEYTVSVANPGEYSIDARVASINTGGTFHIEIGGVNITGTKTVPNTGGWQNWTTVNSTVALDPGEQVVRAHVENGGWNLNNIVVSAVPQSPYSGVIQLPGILQAENFDNGGESVAYHDSVLGNEGGQYRSTNVDIGSCPDTGGGYNIGWMTDGEWWEYTVNVAATAAHSLKMRVSSDNSNGRFRIYVDDQDKTGLQSVPNTGGWSTYQTVTVNGVNLTAGQHILKVHSEIGAWNFNYLDVTSGQSPYSGVIQLPGTAEAENYDQGGEGIAYHDVTPGNNWGQYRSDDVDIDTCPEGGYNIGSIDDGEWLEYTVNVASTGQYNLQMRTSSDNSNGRFHIEMNGQDVTGQQTVPNTGWGTYTTVTVSNVSLNAGQQILRVYADVGLWNFNYLGVAATGSAPSFVAAGTVANGTGSITPALPAGLQTNDILLLFLETANQAISITNQNGGTWAQVTGSPQYTGSGSSATRLTAFWSRYNGTQGAPTVSDSGDHQLGRIIAIRGATTSGNPWDVTAGGVESTSDTSGSIPGVTTTVANTLVVAVLAASTPDATGTSQYSGWSNANLTSLTERVDNTTSSGNGGGLAVATGVKATAGATGNTAVTLANAAAKAMMSIAIKP